MCTLTYRRSPLSGLISMIRSSGFLVTSSSLYLANFLRSLVLKAPVVGSNSLESFVRASLAYPYVLDFVFASSTIPKKVLSSCQLIIGCEVE